jgi:hypothetical protein
MIDTIQYYKRCPDCVLCEELDVGRGMVRMEREKWSDRKEE